MLVYRPRIVRDKARRPQMVAVVEELKLLYRRIRSRCRAAGVGTGQTAVNALLRAVALENSILDSLASYQCNASGEAALREAMVKYLSRVLQLFFRLHRFHL